MIKKRQSPWKKIQSTIVYENSWMKIRHDDVIRPDGKPGVYGVVVKPAFVFVVPRYQNTWVLVRQYRYPLQKSSLEFPSGDIKKGAGTVRSAIRELEEEAGFRAKEEDCSVIGKLNVSPGHHTQSFFVCFVHTCRKTKQLICGDESPMEVVLLTSVEVERAIRLGRITDAQSIAAFYLVQQVNRRVR